MKDQHAARYVQDVALKIRVLATAGATRGEHSYRAEAYEETDPFRTPVWTCPHEHETAHAAHECGEDWLQATERSNAPG
ncbi:MAG TPA: hypothetical protein VGG31_01415 [Candidatus Dormibacteraeota bacterium]|jgi:hypothetical protein